MSAPIVPISQGLDCAKGLYDLAKAGQLAKKQKTAGENAGTVIIAVSQNLLTDQPDVTPIGSAPPTEEELVLARNALAEVEFYVNDINTMKAEAEVLPLIPIFVTLALQALAAAIKAWLDKHTQTQAG